MLAKVSNASTVLTWVRPDLDKHLDQIRNQIEHIASSDHIGDGLENTRQHLKQLKYTFESLVLQGATLVFEEMIRVCDRLKRLEVHDHQLAFGALMDAIVVVPSYLDRLQAGHQDLPVLLLPVINKLRTAYNANIVSEATLFAPKLDVPLPELEAEMAAGDHAGDTKPGDKTERFQSFAQRTRRQYENALLTWLQNQDDTSLLSPLHSLCMTMRRRSERLDLVRLWWIAAEVIGGLIDGAVDNNVHIHRLFARLNLVLRSLGAGGEAATDSKSVDAVSQALLFHIAQARSGCAGVDLLRERFGLKTLVPDHEALLRARGAVTGRNRDLYNSLGAAVRDELSLIKDVLDLEQRTGVVETSRRNESRAALLRLKDTLNMMGLGDTARSIDQLLDAIDGDKEAGGDAGQGATEPPLLELAEQLIQVESVLEEQIKTLGEPLDSEPEEKLIDLPTHELRRFQAQLLDEAVVSLNQVQEGVHSYFGGYGEADYMSPLEHIAGALEMLGDAQPADLALQLRNALGNLLRPVSSESSINREKLDMLTDSVAAFELYLAGCRDQQENQGQFLETLKDRLSHLPVSEMKPLSRFTVPVPQAQETQPRTTPQPASSAATDDGQQVLDPDLLEVFLEEYDDVAGMLNTQIPRWLKQHEDNKLITEIRRGFHTLKGSGRMVGAEELGEFSWHIEEMLNAHLAGRIEALDDVAVIVELAAAALPALKLRLLNKPNDLKSEAIFTISRQASRLVAGNAPQWDEFEGLLNPTMRAVLPAIAGGIAPAAREPAPETAHLGAEDVATPDHRLCEDLASNLLVLRHLVDSISMDRNTVTDDTQLGAIQSVASTAALRPLGREVDVAKALEGLLDAQQQSRKPFSNDALWSIATSLAHLQTCLAIHQGDQEAELTNNEDEQIEHLLALGVEYEPPVLDEAEIPADTPAEAAGDSTATAEPEPAEKAAEPEPAGPPQDDPIDTEILAIFLEEAIEILARSDTLLNTWRDDLSNLEIVKNLQREIHTFKGGARMSGLSVMGNLSHAMESLLERIAGKMLPPSVSAVEALEQGCDRLNSWVDDAATGRIPQSDEALKLFEQQMSALIAVPVRPASGPPVTEAQEATEDELQEIPDVAEPEAEPEQEAEVAASEETTATQQIRVDAELLDTLVNSSGEISIFRSRLEQQVAALRENLKESDATVVRLREQFRKLELEIETQIRSRYQHEAPSGSEEFDPLELDRFSSIQQLSRGLSESVSDLINLQEMLNSAAHKSEVLLVKQSRVSADLQEGLMQTRLVHFGTIAPRLRRIVRTAAGETGKKARLQLRMTGGGDQLDRNVLERITAPLEHLLRNAIVHGIEKPATRAKLSKPAEGEISITVAAEATEFVIRVEDDGAGLNLEAIRKRAVASGLLDKGAEPKPQQLAQFILHSGFTTAAKVTGLAGRGVGLDVVNSEIKQIGGSTEIDSEPGKGSCFTIRIPFTLAVMQAIGVMAGEHRYLIPLSSVAGVGRLLPADYQQLLTSDSPSYGFAGEQFTLLDLEPLLGEPATPLDDDTVSILLIKSGELRAALRVPQLLGHREILIKPVGPQISGVPGILGGTITGDGQVVVIIDAGPLIRRALLSGSQAARPMDHIDIRPRRPLAMVVDDSITMRKVTSRVLEGHDFEVVTARDGVDATEQMQDKVPDLLLLDVEMPRMDGYAVAEFVRAEARLRHIPIIMITSRAGEKHRERGKRAGANAYLSKPYKESDLIAEVNKLLGREVPADG